jgi:hypothetical protein
VAVTVGITSWRVYDDVIGGGSGGVFSVPMGSPDVGFVRISGVTREGVPAPGFMLVVQPKAASDAASPIASSK